MLIAETVILYSKPHFDISKCVENKTSGEAHKV